MKHEGKQEAYAKFQQKSSSMQAWRQACMHWQFFFIQSVVLVGFLWPKAKETNNKRKIRHQICHEKKKETVKAMQFMEASCLLRSSVGSIMRPSSQRAPTIPFFDRRSNDGHILHNGDTLGCEWHAVSNATSNNVDLSYLELAIALNEDEKVQKDPPSHWEIHGSKRSKHSFRIQVLSFFVSQFGYM